MEEALGLEDPTVLQVLIRVLSDGTVSIFFGSLQMSFIFNQGFDSRLRLGFLQSTSKYRWSSLSEKRSVGFSDTEW